MKILFLFYNLQKENTLLYYIGNLLKEILPIFYWFRDWRVY